VTLQGQNVVTGIAVSVDLKYARGPLGAVGAAPDARLRGIIKKWANKSKAHLNITWEDKNGGSVEHCHDDREDGIFLLNEDNDFRLEPFPDGRPAPVAPVTAGDTALISATNLKDPDVLQTMAANMTSNAQQYLQDRFYTQRAGQLERLRCARIFNPLWAKGNLVTLASLDCLVCFRFFSRPHPKLAPYILKMKNELAAYKALIDGIPPRSEREVQDADGKTYDTFDIREWWVSVREKLPGFFMVLRAVLTHAPNSAPPERLFSILNDSFGSDQTRARADYIEYSLMRQFNERTRD